MYRWMLSALLFLLAACTDQAAGRTLVLRYEDFGPPSAAYELIGMDWWQWQAHGDPRPRRYEIGVVVYRGIDLEQARTQYPVDSSREQDYRYVAYEDALRYLDRMIAENAVEPLTEKLKGTRRQIVGALGDGEGGM